MRDVGRRLIVAFQICLVALQAGCVREVEKVVARKAETNAPEAFRAAEESFGKRQEKPLAVKLFDPQTLKDKAMDKIGECAKDSSDTLADPIKAAELAIADASQKPGATLDSVLEAAKKAAEESTPKATQALTAKFATCLVLP